MNSTAYKLMELYNWRYSSGSTTKEYQSVANADVALIHRNLDFSDAFVCDVGCGSGAHLLALAEAGVKYSVGIDLSTEALTRILYSHPLIPSLLIHGDFREWVTTEQFDALVCSLLPIKFGLPNETEKIFHKLSTLLKVNGILFLKLFVREKVGALIGHYEVRYNQSSPIKVSDVTFTRKSNRLVIKQHYEDRPETLQSEELYLPSFQEITSSLSHLALEVLHVLPLSHLKDDVSVPGTVSLLAKKR